MSDTGNPMQTTSFNGVTSTTPLLERKFTKLVKPQGENKTC